MRDTSRVRNYLYPYPFHTLTHGIELIALTRPFRLSFRMLGGGLPLSHHLSLRYIRRQRSPIFWCAGVFHSFLFTLLYCSRQLDVLVKSLLFTFYWVAYTAGQRRHG